MKERAVIVLLMALFSISFISAAQESQMPVVNESTYINISNEAWKGYSEDLRYSSQILNDFAHKNVTRDQALASTMGLYLLTFQSTNNIGRVMPPEKYGVYHNHTVQSMTSLQWYLWNMAKFYETNRTEYVITAYDYFNLTKDYRDKALEEQMLNITQ